MQLPQGNVEVTADLDEEEGPSSRTRTLPDADISTESSDSDDFPEPPTKKACHLRKHLLPEMVCKHRYT